MEPKGPGKTMVAVNWCATSGNLFTAGGNNSGMSYTAFMGRPIFRDFETG